MQQVFHSMSRSTTCVGPQRPHRLLAADQLGTTAFDSGRASWDEVLWKRLEPRRTMTSMRDTDVGSTAPSAAWLAASSLPPIGPADGLVSGSDNNSRTAVDRIHDLPDPVASPRLGWLLALALGCSVLAVAAGVAAASATNTPCSQPGLERNTAWVLSVGMAFAFAAASLVTFLVGAVIAVRRRPGAVLVNLWIATFVLGAVLVPTVLAALIGGLLLLADMSRGFNCM